MVEMADGLNRYMGTCLKWLNNCRLARFIDFYYRRIPIFCIYNQLAAILFSIARRIIWALLLFIVIFYKFRILISV